ncbi:hypothetical protein IL306_009436 [Fusarium sp. DS 682]|nr:hypothetical protein IL306_009436 [Fusarium sp. DS 682]
MRLPDRFFWVAFARAARTELADLARAYPQRERKQVERDGYINSASAIPGSSSPTRHSSSEFEVDANDVDEDEYQGRRNKPEEVTVHLVSCFLQYALNLCLTQHSAGHAANTEVRLRVERMKTNAHIAGDVPVTAEDDGGVCRVRRRGVGWETRHPWLALLEAKRAFRYFHFDEKFPTELNLGLEHGILPGLSSLPPRGDGKANDTPDVDQHMLKRRKAHKSMARVDSCSREVHRELSHPITASKPKTTSETSSRYDSVVRGDQEYSPPAWNSDSTEALSESCYTDDGSDHHARKRRKLRRSSTRGKPRQRLHAASPSSRRPPSNDKQDEGDPWAPPATFQEWSLEDATLKRVFIGGQTLFQIQFSWNSRMNHHSVANVGSRAGVRVSTPRRSRRASRRAIGHAFTPEEDNLLIGLKESQDRLPWSEIHKRFSGIFPGQRSQSSLQVHYCKLRGRKKTESPVMLPQEDQPTGRPQRS